jgi:hypothetical protein
MKTVKMFLSARATETILEEGSFFGVKVSSISVASNNYAWVTLEYNDEQSLFFLGTLVGYRDARWILLEGGPTSSKESQIGFATVSVVNSKA